jgi:hypothetical protein
MLNDGFVIFQSIFEVLQNAQETAGHNFVRVPAVFQAVEVGIQNHG